MSTQELSSQTMFPEKLVKRFHAIKTPFYYYDVEVLKRTLDFIRKLSEEKNYYVHYALKANANDKILKLIHEYGLGADCVSGNEVKKALESGFSPGHIVFAGVGKSDEEITFALNKDIFCFNCESLQEIEVISELARRLNKTPDIALRINPNVSVNTHHYITTGLEENKFGINLNDLEEVIGRISKLGNIRLMGMHFHIGSQITELESFRNLCNRVNEIQAWFASHRISIEHVNVGGGLGVDYREPDKDMIQAMEEYFNVFSSFLELRPGQKLHFELGRAVVAQCGNLISRVLYIKKGLSTQFVILDAGMTELIRPALYQSYHKIENITNYELRTTNYELKKYDVVGPICESSDCFGKAVDLPETQRGDLIAIRTAGAYGEVMASQYNLRERVKAFYSDEICN